MIFSFIHIDHKRLSKIILVGFGITRDILKDDYKFILLYEIIKSEKKLDEVKRISVYAS